jgi:hypothetical protein
MNDLHIKPKEWEEDDLSILAIVVFCLVLTPFALAAYLISLLSAK